MDSRTCLIPASRCLGRWDHSLARPVEFGLGIAMTAFTRMSWGWLGWGLSWLTPVRALPSVRIIFRIAPRWRIGDSGAAVLALFRNGERSPLAERRSTIASRPAGYNGATAQGFAQRPARDAYTGSAPRRRIQPRLPNTWRRKHPAPQEAYNRAQPMASRSQQYGRPSYGYGPSFNGRPAESYGSRPGTVYGGSMQAYRAPAEGFQRGDFQGGPASALVGKGFAKSYGKPARLREAIQVSLWRRPRAEGLQWRKDFSSGHSAEAGIRAVTAAANIANPDR